MTACLVRADDRVQADTRDAVLGLAALPGITVTADLLASVHAADPQALVERGFLRPTAEGRWRFSSTAIAAARRSPSSSFAAVLDELGRYYQRHLTAVELTIEPYRQQEPDLPDFAGEVEALDWVGQELATLIGVMGALTRIGAKQLAAQRVSPTRRSPVPATTAGAAQLRQVLALAALLRSYWLRRKDITPWDAVEKLAGRAAKLLCDDRERARVHERLGYLHHAAGELDQALHAFSFGMAVWERLDDNDARLACLSGIATVRAASGEPQAALTAFLEVLAGRESPREKELTGIQIGLCHQALGDYAAAVGRFTRAAQCAELDDCDRAMAVLYRCQSALLQAPHSDLSREIAAAEAIFRRKGSECGRAEVLALWAFHAHVRGNRRDARLLYKKAGQAFGGLGHQARQEALHSAAMRIPC